MRDLPKSTTHVVKKASDIFVQGERGLHLYGASIPHHQLKPAPIKPSANSTPVKPPSGAGSAGVGGGRLSDGIKASPTRRALVSDLTSSSSEGEDARGGFSVDDILSDVTGGEDNNGVEDDSSSSSSSSTASEAEIDEEEDDDDDDELTTNGSGDGGDVGLKELREEVLPVGEECSLPRVMKRNGGGAGGSMELKLAVDGNGIGGVVAPRVRKLRDGKQKGNFLDFRTTIEAVCG